jgi:hypothetical protein
MSEQNTSKMAASMIITCRCKHDSQDQLHGRHRRVHNLCRGKSNAGNYRCTVCSTEKRV